jgi:hypothetical protein
MNYRNLTSREIESLKNQGCSSSDWNLVKVKEGFKTSHIFEVHFHGDVRLGIFEPAKGVELLKRPGLYHSVISDSSVADHARIADVNLIHGYEIQEEVIIERVDELSVNSISSFGNGQVLDVLNEGGGRELPLYDGLTSQVAYMTVLYQHDHELVKALKFMIHQYVESKKSGKGIIAKKAMIRNSSVIRNVMIGESAMIDGARLLQEGTIVSCADDPARIGEGVMAKHFIIHHGSYVESYAMLDKVFVGQGVRIGKQFSAENSVFFANCEGFHGEAVSLFAGPYSVSHHKSSLLIAALISFYNAGSGTNQSNHMYKLGPLHQGILERGCKTGSFAYLLWPCRVGAFSVVMGKHSGNFDTSDFPFSYITVEEEKSFLTPGMNLITVGTRRDVEKWPARDRRKTNHKLDLITFDWLNPMIIKKSIDASQILGELYDKTSKEQDSVSYKGVRIKRLLLKSCRKYYDMLTPVFLGEQLIQRVEAGKSIQPGPVRISIDQSWIDLGGMITTLSAVEDLMQEIKSRKINSIEQLAERLSGLNKSYGDMVWEWTLSLVSKVLEKPVEKIGNDDFSKIVMDWKENKIRLNNMILSDAKKEFDQSSRIGFGVDGDERTRDEDFSSVRGTYDGNKFVKALLVENIDIETKAAAILEDIAKYN